MWIFEPHVAEQVFEDLVTEHDIPVHRDEWLDREKGVQKTGGRITVDHHAQRQDVSRPDVHRRDLRGRPDGRGGRGRITSAARRTAPYGEKWNGVQTGVLHHRHHFGVLKQPIDPYVVPGDPASGVLPRISTEPPGKYGAGRQEGAGLLFPHVPDRPSREPHAVSASPPATTRSNTNCCCGSSQAGWRETFDKFDPIPNHKTDTNNHGPFSTDNIGNNYDYPEASLRAPPRDHPRARDVSEGLLYFIANDPRVPEDVRTEMSKWGLAKDEFTDNGNWPHQIYVREARRMIGRYVMTENELLKRRPTPDSVGMGSYTIDSHNVQRYITPEGYVQNEGDIGVGTNGPYEIAYGSLVPKKDQCENLLVPVCVSSSHIAFGSIRMEPVFMILGQSAATAAVLAIDAGMRRAGRAVCKLRERLLQDGQVLESAGRTAGPACPVPLEGIVVDDAQATLTASGPTAARWEWVGSGYLHDGNASDGKSVACFEAKLRRPAVMKCGWRTRPSQPGHEVPVVVRHAGGEKTVLVNQKQSPAIDGLFVSLGVFEFTADRPPPRSSPITTRMATSSSTPCSGWRIGATRMPDPPRRLTTPEPVAEFRLLGRVPFEALLALQSRLVYEAGGLDQPRIVVLLCEHPDLITVGRAGSQGAHPVHGTISSSTSNWASAGSAGVAVACCTLRASWPSIRSCRWGCWVGPWASTCGDCSGGLSMGLPN